MRVFGVQVKGNNSQSAQWSVLVEQLEKAHQQGAQLVILPELFLNPYFCITQDSDNFSLAVTPQDEKIQWLLDFSKKTSMVLVVPFFEKQDRGVYYNSLLVTDTQGGHYGLYRKMHIPDDPGFNEKYYFIPGDLGYKVFETPYGKIGTLICWDQWFPEAARLTALMGCDLLVYPTAIGWDEKEWQGLNPGEVEKLKEAQKNAWHMMQRSHAIANGVFVAGINRVGIEGHLHFWGNSFICAPSGEFLASADATSETLIHAECSSQEISEHRHLWPFLRDRRTDSYGGLLSKYIGNKT